MFLFYNEYQFIFIYFNICFCFVLFLLIALYVCSVYAPDNCKGVPYECGFLAFSDSRELFNIQFYIIALLFLIFDLEIILLLPWCLTISVLGWSAYLASMVFLLLLTFGFIFEWYLGVFYCTGWLFF